MIQAHRGDLTIGRAESYQSFFFNAPRFVVTLYPTGSRSFQTTHFVDTKKEALKLLKSLQPTKIKTH